MSLTATSLGAFRFGVFEMDLQDRELRKRGVRLKLETKPLQILELMLERPGEIITRKQIQERLWSDTYVLFDYSVNTAVNKLRLALGDSAENPRFIETVARRGYRFIANVERMSATASPSSATSANAPISSIAVLPFQNSGEDQELEYLSDGLSEAVIRRVSQIPGVRVMAWSAVLRYKNRDLDPLAAGRDLRVRSVLVGRVVEGADSVSLSVELVDADSGWRLWGEEYRRGRGEVHTVSDEIARQIAVQLQPQAKPAEGRHWPQQHTANADAFSDYLKGRYHWHKLSADGLKKSVSYFELAIAKDPNFALAHSALADAYVLFAFVLLPPREALERAREAAQRALKIDDRLADAHASCATITKLYDWNWPQAEREYRRALELDPNNAIARRGYGSLLAALGRPEEALLQVRKAQELDPTSLVVGVEAVWNLYMAREYGRAVQQAMKMAEIEPDFPASGHALGLALEQLGKCDEAIACLTKVSERTEAHQATIASLAHAYARCGRTKDAQAIVDELAGDATKRYVAPYLFAVIHAGLGEREKSLAWLERGYDLHDVWMVWLNRDPRFDLLRVEPRFQNLLRRMNFAA